jgi:ABC-type phosphate transport system substrate-binding protein
MSRLILFFALLAGLAVSAHADDAVFIVNPQGADAELSSDSLKSVLIGNKTKWDGGGLIKLAVLTSGPVHDKVIQDNTQRSADQFDKYWKKLVFTGKGFMPMQAADEAALVDYVAKTPGALGYVSSGAVTDRVKVIPIK